MSASAFKDAARFRADPLDPRHGTNNGYSNGLCRCERCKEAAALQRRRWRRTGQGSTASVTALPIGIACRCGGRLIPCDGRYGDWKHNDTRSEFCPDGSLAFPVERAWRKAGV